MSMKKFCNEFNHKVDRGVRYMNIVTLFKQFLESYNEEEKDEIWGEQSERFKNFWDNKVGDSAVSEIDDEDIDDIVLLLDKNAKGSTRETEAVAKAMIPQGVWRRMFNDIHSTKNIYNLLTKIFEEDNSHIKAEYIDRLYELNQGRKNSLTGQSAGAINCFLAVCDPRKNISMISLNDRFKIMKYLGVDLQNWEELSIGKKIVKSNHTILTYFRERNIYASARTINSFLYSTLLKEEWKGKLSSEKEMKDDEGTRTTQEQDCAFIFGLEKHLEDFLIENWSMTELGKKYELIEENGELISQQYRTNIGIIDILVREKESGNYVVIELKRNQTSDDTVGQLARYMGWIKKNKANGSKVKGIIVARKYDEKLDYAIQMLKDVEVFIYKLDFKLEEHGV